MKRFLIKTLLFIVLIFFVFGICEYSLLNKANSYSYKRNNLEMRLDSLEILILGTSHAYMGINPKYISQKAFNMANVSQSLYYDYSIFNTYKNKLKSLEMVIISISSFSFGFKISESDPYRGVYYYLFMNIDHEERKKTLDLKYNSLTALYGLKKSIKVLLDENPTKDVTQLGGYMENDFEFEWFKTKISNSSGAKLAKSHFELYNKLNVVNNKAYLEQLIDNCKKMNIKVVLITEPVNETYYKNENQQMLAEKNAIINDIKSRFGVQYYDYSKDKRFLLEDFRDNDHLNPNGAKKFSMILDKEVIQLINKKNNWFKLTR